MRFLCLLTLAFWFLFWFCIRGWAGGGGGGRSSRGSIRGSSAVSEWLSARLGEELIVEEGGIELREELIVQEEGTELRGELQLDAGLGGETRWRSCKPASAPPSHSSKLMSKATVVVMMDAKDGQVNANLEVE